jgi:polyisoprenoid-binding protein YceI
MKHLLFFIALCLVAGAARAESLCEIHVSLYPAGSFVAKTNKVTGLAKVSKESVEASHIVVDLVSLDSGIQLRNQHMQNHFEVKKYPRATLLSAQGKDGRFKGRMELRGVTRDVEGTYKALDDKIGQATFKTKLSDFKIEEASYMGVGVEDEVEVRVTLPYRRD